MRESEGDPQVKGKIRARQREAAMARMMQAVPQADVVVTNRRTSQWPSSTTRVAWVLRA
jgi:flagellar biosynthesis protein FlhB